MKSNKCYFHLRMPCISVRLETNWRAHSLQTLTYNARPLTPLSDTQESFEPHQRNVQICPNKSDSDWDWNTCIWSLQCKKLILMLLSAILAPNRSISIKILENAGFAILLQFLGRNEDLALAMLAWNSESYHLLFEHILVTSFKEQTLRQGTTIHWDTMLWCIHLHLGNATFANKSNMNK